jgi:hypothetical protein
MKHWEEAGLLTEVLDRQVKRLVQEIPSSDWTLFWHIGPFLQLLEGEPVLSAFVREYLDEEAQISGGLEAELRRIRREIAALLTENEPTFRELAVKPDNQASEHFEEVVACLRSNGPIDLARCASALETIVRWFSEDSESSFTDSKSASLKDQLTRVQTRWCQLDVAFRAHSTTDPGAAYLQLHEASRNLQFQDAPVDSDQNNNSRRLHGFIRESELWLGIEEGNLSQPAVVNLQRAVRTLHLALVTSLVRGRSRWATAKRFAARCESLDREHLRSILNAAKGKAEAILTLEFARYLFDGGYNPLVDATTCGLRPDVLDATTEPAIYVEAKQYENVGDGVATKLGDGVAQTLNTWSRLAKRWDVPEAFLLVFRRSGRPIELESTELRVNGGRLYVLCVDLAEASESGSRAEIPVRIDLKALLENAKASAVSEEGEAHGNE